MRTLVLAVALIVAMSLAGCEALCAPSCGAPREHYSSSSVVDFLYPSGALPPAENSTPPLRVGLAFLPPHDPSAVGPDAALKEQLLERVRQHFLNRGGAGAFSSGWLVALVPLLLWRLHRRAAAGRRHADQHGGADAGAPSARAEARRPAARSGMRRPRTARSVRAIRMRVPRLSVRN